MLFNVDLEGMISFTEAKLPQDWGLSRRQGKVRDIFPIGEDLLAIVATDRLSAFDQVLACVPGKGQILTQLSAWWFDPTSEIVPNHLVDVPDPNVMIVRRLSPIPLEMVVRGYLTGSTDTSIWRRYQRGERNFAGMTLSDGMMKNEPLPYPIVDPTTKAEEGHDKKVTQEEILDSRLVTPLQWQALKSTSLALFNRGQRLTQDAGLILVDTKYEFGWDPVQNSIVLIDEVHTPDSSRFWNSGTYKERLGTGNEPDSLDKEFARLWLVDQGYRGDGTPPEIPDGTLAEILGRYADTYTRFTGKQFEQYKGDVNMRVAANLRNWLGK